MALDDFARLPFTLHVPGGETLEFDTYEKVAEWAENEREAWGVLSEAQKALGPAGQSAVGTQIGCFKALNQHAATPITDERHRTARDEVAKLLDLIAQGNVVVSTSPTGRKILDLITTDPKKALGHLIWEVPDIKIPVGKIQDLGPILKTLIDVRLDQREGIGDVAAEKAALESLRAKWEENFDGVRASLAHLEREFENWASITMATTTNRIRQARRVSKKVVRLFRDMRDTHDAEMKAIRETFKTDLSLREPATYWTKKAGDHAKDAKSAFWGLLAIAAVIVLFALAAPWIVLTGDAVKELGLAATLLVGVPAVALFWVMKAVARIFVTNIQLHADAQLRHTMVTTFISLMQDPKNQMSTEDRILILQALFRPAGAEAHEEGPPSWMDFLVRRMEGPSK